MHLTVCMVLRILAVPRSRACAKQTNRGCVERLDWYGVRIGGTRRCISYQYSVWTFFNGLVRTEDSVEGPWTGLPYHAYHGATVQAITLSPGVEVLGSGTPFHTSLGFTRIKGTVRGPLKDADSHWGLDPVYIHSTLLWYFVLLSCQVLPHAR